jgi:hypothetical protein
MQKSLAIKPSDDYKSYINAIGGLLGKTLPSGWENARFYIEKNNNIAGWKGTYSLKGSDERAFTLNKVLFANLEKLRDVEKYICPMSELTFYSDGRYEINYEHTEIERLAPSEIQEEIKKLKEIDLKSVDVESLKKHINAINKGHELTSPIISAGSKLYRGVLWQEKPVNISQLCYPPQESVKKIHRAGRVNQPLFYCSFARDAVFHELGVHTVDKLVVSEWETVSSLIVNNVGYYPEALEKLGASRTMPYWYNEQRPEAIEENKQVRQFFADEFTKIVPPGQEHLYKLSVAIAEMHFGFDMFDGLIYPAMAMRGNADNLAIKPSSVDNKLVLKKVEYYQITECCKDVGYRVRMLDFANSFSENGQIEWKGRLPHWVLRNRGEALEVAVENGKWVARNLQGEMVEPE